MRSLIEWVQWLKINHMHLESGKQVSEHLLSSLSWHTRETFRMWLNVNRFTQEHP